MSEPLAAARGRVDFSLQNFSEERQLRKDLRLIRDKYMFETAAQVDQALWTLHIGVHRGFLQNTEHLRKAHSQDTFLRSIKVKNVADAMFGEIDRVDLVEALAGHRPGLAGVLAALEFERTVRGYSKAKPDQELKAIIETTAPARVRGDWHWCRIRRNDAVHGRRNLDYREVQTLVHHTREIEALIEKRRS